MNEVDQSCWDQESYCCGCGRVAFGVGLGMITAMVLDATALAWHHRLPLQPVLAVDRERTVIGAAASF